MEYFEWYCKDCGHEVLASERPANIKWTDGHICIFIRRWTEEERINGMKYAGYKVD